MTDVKGKGRAVADDMTTSDLLGCVVNSSGVASSSRSTWWQESRRNAKSDRKSWDYSKISVIAPLILAYRVQF